MLHLFILVTYMYDTCVLASYWCVKISMLHGQLRHGGFSTHIPRGPGLALNHHCTDNEEGMCTRGQQDSILECGSNCNLRRSVGLDWLLS